MRAFSSYETLGSILLSLEQVKQLVMAARTLVVSASNAFWSTPSFNAAGLLAGTADGAASNAPRTLPVLTTNAPRTALGLNTAWPRRATSNVSACNGWGWLCCNRWEWAPLVIPLDTLWFSTILNTAWGLDGAEHVGTSERWRWWRRRRWGRCNWALSVADDGSHTFTRTRIPSCEQDSIRLALTASRFPYFVADTSARDLAPSLSYNLSSGASAFTIVALRHLFALHVAAYGVENSRANTRRRPGSRKGDQACADESKDSCTHRLRLRDTRRTATVLAQGRLRLDQGRPQPAWCSIYT